MCVLSFSLSLSFISLSLFLSTSLSWFLSFSLSPLSLPLSIYLSTSLFFLSLSLSLPLSAFISLSFSLSLLFYSCIIYLFSLKFDHFLPLEILSFLQPFHQIAIFVEFYALLHSVSYIY